MQEPLPCFTTIGLRHDADGKLLGARHRPEYSRSYRSFRVFRDFDVCFGPDEGDWSPLQFVRQATGQELDFGTCGTSLMPSQRLAIRDQ